MAKGQSERVSGETRSTMPIHMDTVVRSDSTRKVAGKVLSTLNVLTSGGNTEKKNIKESTYRNVQ